MNIENLIEAAKEIDMLSKKQEEKTKKLQELASQARKVRAGGINHQRIIAESRSISSTVICFGDAVNRLRKALKQRKTKE